MIGLFTELTTLKKEEAETLTDYVLRGETAAALLKNAGETVSDNLLIAMILNTGGIIWEVEGRGSGSKGVAYHTDSPTQVEVGWWVGESV